MASPGKSPRPDRLRRCALVLLAVAAVPDVLPYAGLKTLVGERFQVGDIQAQLFALAALLGALFAVPLLIRIRRMSPRRVFMFAAITQAIVIASMALPIDWWHLLVLRGVQGAVDLLLLAILVTIVASSARATGRAFGAAGAAIMVGLAVGLIAGGILAANFAAIVFPAAALVSVVLATTAWFLPATPLASGRSPSRSLRDQQIVAGGAFAASDRMINGMLTVTLPLLLAAAYGASPTLIGVVLAAPLLACAVGGYFSGILVDRIGAVQARLAGVPLQAVGVALIVFSNGAVPVLVVGTLLLALGAVVLMPTSLVIGAGRRPKEVGTDAVGGVQAMGQAGHLTGVLAIIGITGLLGAVTPSGVLVVLGAYLLWNGAWLLRLRTLEPLAQIGGVTREGWQRRSVGPINVRARRPRSQGLIEPISEVYPGASPEEMIEEPSSCPNTNTNAPKTAKS